MLFDLCFFFTVFSFLMSEVVWQLIFKFLALVAWNVLAVFYTLTSPLVPAVGYLFYVIGLAFFLVLVKDVFTLTVKRRNKGWGEEL